MKTEMEIRAEATEATRLKFHNRPYEWGKVDCIRMARFHALKMGHRPPKLPRYSNELGAIRAIKKTGFESIEQIFDSMFPKIPLAFARVGDFVVAEGENGVDAVFISAGRKIMGFHESADKLVMVTPEIVKAAYRV